MSDVGLTRHGAETYSVFDLAGHDKNDLTAALGFALSRCSTLRTMLIEQLFPAATQPTDIPVGLALEVRGDSGRTDLELTLPGALVIIEAKRDWLLPSVSQLAQYAPRIQQHGGGALVTLSQASHELADAQLPHEVCGVPVEHLPWRDVLRFILNAKQSCRGRERIWLDELQNYLTGVIKVRSVADCWTYSVALSNARPGDGGNRTFLEYVTEDRCYFHPYGAGGWPTEPPNFMAFRWGGAVQRIHRVVVADVIPSLLDRWPDIPATTETVRPHALYELGPRLPPFEPIPNGAQYRASRLWVLLDQLQASPTLAAARDQSRQLEVER